jgi:hypothetical protein
MATATAQSVRDPLAEVFARAPVGEPFPPEILAEIQQAEADIKAGLARGARPARASQVRTTIIWSPAALRAFYALPPHTAMVVDRAVIRLAERHEGHVEWVAPYHRLRAGMHEVALRFDETAQTLNVLYLYRASR